MQVTLTQLKCGRHDTCIVRNLSVAVEVTRTLGPTVENGIYNPPSFHGKIRNKEDQRADSEPKTGCTSN